METLPKFCILRIGAYLSNLDLLSMSLTCRKMKKKFRPSFAKRIRIVRKKEEREWYAANKHIFEAEKKQKEKEHKQYVKSICGHAEIVKEINKIKYEIYEGYSERTIKKNQTERSVISRIVYGRHNFCAFLPSKGPIMRDAGEMIYKRLIGQGELKNYHTHYVLAINHRFYYRRCKFINGEFEIISDGTLFRYSTDVVKTPAEYIRGDYSCCIIVEARPSVHK
ncbi:hypothetical protein PV-S19_0444 [Pacmanvirus S19]|nr:hypothetical protein PV-S19_0444 [Pacmanvirus S19]